MPAVPLVARVGQQQRGIASQLPQILSGERAATRIEGVEPRQLHQADARGDVGQVVLAARNPYVKFAIGGAVDAVKAVAACLTYLLRLVEDQRSAFDRGHILVGMETEDDHVADAADALAAPPCPHGVRGILDNAHAVASGARVQRFHVHRVSGEVHRHDRTGSQSECSLELVEIDVPGLELDVDEYRPGTDPQDHVGGRCKRHRGNDDFMARPDTGDLESHFQRCGRAGERKDGTSAQVFGKRRFERFHARS